MAIKFDELLEALDLDNKEFIPTGLRDNKAKDVLDSVMGQLSDGIWENSPGMNKYWEHADIDFIGNEINIVVDNSWGSGFRGKSPEEIKKWFAKKVKQIIKEEGLAWKRDNEESAEYMHGDVKVRDAYRVYDKLLGRIDRITESLNLNEAFNRYTFGQDFEKHIPYNMRYKEYDFVKDNGQDILYWVTQEPFDDSDIEDFQYALSNETDFDGALVILRDDSSYIYDQDKNSGGGVFIENTYADDFEESLNEDYDDPEEGEAYESYYNALDMLDDLQDEYNNIKRGDKDSLVDFISNNMGFNTMKKIFGTDISPQLYSFKENALRAGIERWFKKDFLSDMFELDRPLLSKILKIHQAEYESLNEDYLDPYIDELAEPLSRYMQMSGKHFNAVCDYIDDELRKPGKSLSQLNKRDLETLYSVFIEGDRFGESLNESMTKEEVQTKKDIVSYLNRDYPKVASLLNDFDFILTEDPDTVGYVDLNTKKVVLNRNLSMKNKITCILHPLREKSFKQALKDPEFIQRMKDMNKEIEKLSREENESLNEALKDTRVKSYDTQFGTFIIKTREGKSRRTNYMTGKKEWMPVKSTLGYFEDFPLAVEFFLYRDGQDRYVSSSQGRRSDEWVEFLNARDYDEALHITEREVVGCFQDYYGDSSIY